MPGPQDQQGPVQLQHVLEALVKQTHLDPQTAEALLGQALQAHKQSLSSSVGAIAGSDMVSDKTAPKPTRKSAPESKPQPKKAAASEPRGRTKASPKVATKSKPEVATRSKAVAVPKPGTAATKTQNSRYSTGKIPQDNRRSKEVEAGRTPHDTRNLIM